MFVESKRHSSHCVSVTLHAVSQPGERAIGKENCSYVCGEPAFGKREKMISTTADAMWFRDLHRKGIQ
jgi:hypothetical protein